MPNRFHLRPIWASTSISIADVLLEFVAKIWTLMSEIEAKKQPQYRKNNGYLHKKVYWTWKSSLSIHYEKHWWICIDKTEVLVITRGCTPSLCQGVETSHLVISAVNFYPATFKVTLWELENRRNNNQHETYSFVHEKGGNKKCMRTNLNMTCSII